MPPTYMPVDLSSLSDLELSQMLKDYNVNVGPINAATRKTYERKLIKLKTGQDTPPSKHYEPVDDDDDDEDEEIQIKQPVNRTPAASHSPQARLRRDPPEAYSASPRVESRPNLGTSRKTTTSYTPDVSDSSTRYTSQAQTDYSQNAKVNSSKGVPLWVKIIAVAVVLVLLFLIYSNMEPVPVSNIPSIGEKVEV